jgi:hypothetical protein
MGRKNISFVPMMSIMAASGEGKEVDHPWLVSSWSCGYFSFVVFKFIES